MGTYSSESFTDTCSVSLVSHERRQIGLDQPPSGGSYYPFVRPQDGEENVIGDLFLRYYDPDCQFELPFRVSWLFRFGCDNALIEEVVTDRGVEEMQILDAADAVVFDTRECNSFIRRAWGPDTWVTQWIKEGSTGEQHVLRYVHYLHSTESPFSFPVFIRLQNGLLDGRSVQRATQRVTYLSLADAGSSAYDVGVGAPQGRLVLDAGYNASLSSSATSSADGSRRSTTITIDMEPGNGLGRYRQDCDSISDFAVRRINQIAPNAHGDFQITAEENSCARIERPLRAVLASPSVGCRTAKIRDAAVQIDSDCEPCCTCDDFIGVYESIRRLSTVLADYSQRAHAVRDWLSASVQRIEQQRSCRSGNRLRAFAQAECPDRVACAVAYCNSSSECVNNVLIPISFDYEDLLDPKLVAATQYTGQVGGLPGEPYELCGQTRRAGNVPDRYAYQGSVPYTLGGEYPHYWAYFDAIDAYSMGFITFFVEFPESNRGDTAMFAADAYALPEPPLVSATEATLPYLTDHDYVIGGGPSSSSAGCLAWRLVSAPVVTGAAILQAPCCVDDLSDFG